MLPHYYLDDAEANLQTAQRGMRSLSLVRFLPVSVCVCVGVYMLVGCHVNKLYMAARLRVCLFYVKAALRKMAACFI